MPVSISLTPFPADPDIAWSETSHQIDFLVKAPSAFSLNLPPDHSAMTIQGLKLLTYDSRIDGYSGRYWESNDYLMGYTVDGINWFPTSTPDNKNFVAVIKIPIDITRTIPGIYPGLHGSGNNSMGGLGNGSTANSDSFKLSFQQIDWTITGNNGSTIGIKDNGTMWSWGRNDQGQLGLNDTTPRSSPVQVGSLTNWAQASIRGGFTMSVKTDGTLWGWGDNYYGQLGVGNNINTSSPVQVGSLTDWKQVACGLHFATAIKTDGTLWAWGSNEQGQLGQGHTLSRTSPIQIGSLTDWDQISCGSFFWNAIKTDGTLWACGDDGEGVVGNTTSGSKSSPIQVGSLTDWKTVVCGLWSSKAIKTDGTLWGWSNNEYGQLGIGNTTNQSSPVQVGTLTNWSQISGGNSSAAIKTDGTLWTWGDNYRGQLGLGDNVDRSSPVQVGTAIWWNRLGYVNSDNTLVTTTLFEPIPDTIFPPSSDYYVMETVDGEIYFTMDGKNWIACDMTQIPTGFLRLLSYAGRHLWATTYNSTTNMLYRSEDGGETWSLEYELSGFDADPRGFNGIVFGLGLFTGGD